MWRLIPHKNNSEGFTLIEVIVALTIIAVVLSSIGTLIATNTRAIRSIEGHLIRLQIARAIFSALPDRDQLTLGSTVGKTDAQPWRVDVSQFPDRVVNSETWVPLTVVIAVGLQNGGMIELSTVRLQRKNDK